MFCSEQLINISCSGPKVKLSHAKEGSTTMDREEKQQSREARKVAYFIHSENASHHKTARAFEVEFSIVLHGIQIKLRNPEMKIVRMEKFTTLPFSVIEHSINIIIPFVNVLVMEYIYAFDLYVNQYHALEQFNLGTFQFKIQELTIISTATVGT